MRTWGSPLSWRAGMRPGTPSATLPARPASCMTSRTSSWSFPATPPRPDNRQLPLPCRSTPPEKGLDTPPASTAEPTFNYSDPVNQFLGNFLPAARDVAAELAHIDFEAPKARGLTLEALVARLVERLTAAEWFVTGEVDPTLFSDAFAFKDESVGTVGIKSYALGVRKLFDQATSRAQIISVVPDVPGRRVVVTWRLEGRVNLPFRPTIAPYVVTTFLGVDDEGLICSQLDEFSVPGWKLLAGALLGAWAGPEPAPPVEQLRAEARRQASTKA